MPEARQIPDATLEAMVQHTDPAWELRTATPAERGFCTAYRVEVGGDSTLRECYLKASPDGQRWGIPTEARIQAVLDRETTIPVPKVLTVVDEHDSHPAPFYVMCGRPGEDLAYERVGRLEDNALRRLARETGEYLGELHAVPAVEQFGHVRHDGPTLHGERPSGDPAILTIDDPREDWQNFVREYSDRELDRHEDSLFSGLTAELNR